jgi:hypothetical protein
MLSLPHIAIVTSPVALRKPAFAWSAAKSEDCRAGVKRRRAGIGVFVFSGSKTTARQASRERTSALGFVTQALFVPIRFHSLAALVLGNFRFPSLFQ